MARKRKQNWTKGSIFTVPLEDDNYSVGLVLAVTPDALNSFIGAFYFHKVQGVSSTSDIALDFQAPIAVQFVTRDLLDSGVWKVVGNLEKIPDAGDYLPLAEIERNRYVGVTIRGSGIIRKFLNAIHGLGPWNAYPKMGDDYFDKFLIHPRFKPKND